ncbi:MAG: hypothetical protein AAF519_10970 [Bacteroidota bacterium]
MAKFLTEKQWIILAKYLANEKLLEEERTVLIQIFTNRDYSKLIESLDQVFKSSPLIDLDAAYSLKRLTTRIENEQ